jgi:site-specific recombinase XerD
MSDVLDPASSSPGRTVRPLDKAHAAGVPALLAPTEAAATRTLEFFAVTIRNPHTRRAYAHAVSEFSDWCQAQSVNDIRDVRPMHVAAYVESRQLAAPSVKQRLAALRMLFDWLVVGQVMPTNPAGSVRGPKHSVKKGKTPVLTAEEARTLLDTIDTSTVVGLRDRALIGLMVYTFARVGAATLMRAEDVFVQGRRLWVRLHEKGGKEHEMPCHHNLEAWLEAYLQAGELRGSAWLFQTAKGRGGKLSGEPMGQADVFRMIGRRAEAAGIRTKIGCHSFRATGITEYLRNGGKLEIAQRMANHESARTTGLYDRRQDDVSLDEVERILI